MALVTEVVEIDGSVVGNNTYKNIHWQSINGLQESAFEPNHLIFAYARVNQKEQTVVPTVVLQILLSIGVAHI